MKSLITVAVFAVVVLALSPFIGFWIVALVGACLLLLPAGAVVFAVFPKATTSFLNLTVKTACP